MSNKRQDYISWDEYFMGVAYMASMRSKDPNTQVGACIPGQEKGKNWTANMSTPFTANGMRSSITEAVPWRDPRCM